MNNFTEEEEFENSNENNTSDIKSQMLDLQAKLNQWNNKNSDNKQDENKLSKAETNQHKHCSVHCNLGQHNQQEITKPTNRVKSNNQVTNLNDIYGISEAKEVPTFEKTTTEHKVEPIEDDSNLYVVKNEQPIEVPHTTQQINHQDKKIYQAQNSTTNIENYNLELHQKPVVDNTDKGQINTDKQQDIKQVNTTNKVAHNQVNNQGNKQVKPQVNNDNKANMNNQQNSQNNKQINNQQNYLKQKGTNTQIMEQINKDKVNKTEQLFNNITNISQSQMLTQKKFQKPNKDNNNNVNINKPGHNCLDNMLRNDTYLTGEVATLYNDFLYIVKKHNLAKKSEDEIRAAFVESILKFLPKHFENRLEHRALKLFKDKYKWIIDKIYTNQIRTVEDILHFVFYEYESRGYVVDSEQEALYDFMYMPQYSKNTFFAEIVDEYVDSNIRVIPEEQKFNFMKIFKNTDTVKVAKVHWNTQQVHLKAVKQELKNHLKRYLQNGYDKNQMIKELARLEKTI